MKKITEEQEILLAAWLQWSHVAGKSRYSGGLSTLESLEEYLKRNKLINSWGNPSVKI